jgi:environmental stress-induced protein Ves
VGLQFFDRSVLVPMPWKNGGGVTREIACCPPGAGMEDFEWRVSIATIAADGPFSLFNGIDRVIMLLQGAGMRLHSRDARIDHALDKPLMPFAFPGEASLDCTLLSGESQDFNVMTRREKLRAGVRILRGPQQIDRCPHGLLLAAQGAWEVETSRDAGGGEPASRKIIAADAGMWWSDEMLSCRLTPATAGAAMIAVQLMPNKS